MAKKKKKPIGLKFEGDILGDRYKDAPDHMMPRLRRKRARYWCYRFRQEELEGVPAEGAPEGFKEYVEGLKDFMGWGNFADVWDLRGSNPYWCVFRTLSVWQEWDHVLERVAVPINLSARQRHIRMKTLEREYKEPS